MEIRSIMLARSVQIIRTATGTVGYLPDLMEEIRVRYGFITAPKIQDLAPSDPAKGAEFQHGKLIAENRTIIIDKFTIFREGLVADTASSTDDTDLFLDDLAQWAKTASPKAEQSGPRFYISQIEIKMNETLEVYAPRFRPVGEKIATLLSGYGIKVPRYEVSALNLYFDQLGKTPPQPGVFFFDRRLNYSYSENVWFSQAPLKTADHVALLMEFEQNGGVAESG